MEQLKQILVRLGQQTKRVPGGARSLFRNGSNLVQQVMREKAILTDDWSLSRLEIPNIFFGAVLGYWCSNLFEEVDDFSNRQAMWPVVLCMLGLVTIIFCVWRSLRVGTLRHHLLTSATTFLALYAIWRLNNLFAALCGWQVPLSQQSWLFLPILIFFWLTSAWLLLIFPSNWYDG